MSPAPISDPNNNKPEAIASGLIGAVTGMVTMLLTPLDDRVTRHAQQADKRHDDHELRIRTGERFQSMALGGILILTTLGGFLGALAAKLIK